MMFNDCMPREAVEQFVGAEYIQHNPHVGAGKTHLNTARALLAIALLGVLSNACQAQPTPPPGYHWGTPIPLPDSLREVLADGRFRLTVVRSAGSAWERSMITKAENLYPAESNIIESAWSESERDHIAATSKGIAPGEHRVEPRLAGTPGERWWALSFDGTWLPFAATGSAVNYYIKRLRDIAEGRGYFRYGPEDIPDSGSFDYRVSVEPNPEPGVAVVVTLQLRWSYHCGVLCAVAFWHQRRVLFDGNGRVIRIEGDRHPDYSVS